MKIKIVLFCLLFVAVLAFSQESKKKDKTDTGQQAAAAAELEKVDTGAGDETGDDMIESADEYVYKPRGRRDPFWDLLRGKGGKLKREVKEGIAGLEIEQLELEGIVFRNGRYIALFKGPDSKPYDVLVGTNVYDGEIIEIDANRVVFKKILTMALGGTKERTVVKWLNPEKEKEQ